MNKYSSKFCWEESSEKQIKDHIKIVIDSNTEKRSKCLEWVGYKDKDGYGRMRFFNKFVHSTRVLWFLEKGFFPQGKVICHVCDNPSCMTIDHLFIGTEQDNAFDAFKKGRREGRKGEKSNFVKLTEKQVKEIKNLLKLKISQSNIGKMFNVSRGAICDIARNRNWDHIKDIAC